MKGRRFEARRRNQQGHHRCVWFVLAVLVVLTCVTETAPAQPSAGDLSYYPLHVGNIWVYQVSEYYPSHPNWRPTGYVTHEIVGDTLLANSKWYKVFNTGDILRVDSTSGSVYEHIRWGIPRSTCPDSTENEIFNLAINTNTGYSRCNDRSTGFHDTCQIIPLSSERVALLNLMRAQRIWNTSDFLGTHYKLAEGIGVSLMGGAMYTGKQYELYYAKINGTEYYPVELRSFTASLLPDNSVALRWVTANEVQNRGFTVQRSEGAEAALWTNLAFVESAVEEGRGGEYAFTDQTSRDIDRGSVVRYRLQQHDYDGTISYSPVAEVQLAILSELPRLTMYPNPVHAGSFVNINVHGSPTMDLKLYDAYGRRVRTLPHGHRTTMSTAGLTSGVYFLRLDHEAGISIKKLLIH